MYIMFIYSLSVSHLSLSYICIYICRTWLISLVVGILSVLSMSCEENLDRMIKDQTNF